MNRRRQSKMSASTSRKSASPSSSSPLPCSSPLHNILLFAGALRLALILFSEIDFATLLRQDTESPGVKYTDVDYEVYTDAAALLYHGKSIYEPSQADLREVFGPDKRSVLQDELTKYRYSPLIALLMVPNVTLLSAWGKIFFSVCDLLAAIVLWSLVGRLYESTEVDQVTVSNLQCAATISFLWNPFVFALSTRGSCDSLVSLLLFLWLDLLASGSSFLRIPGGGDKGSLREDKGSRALQGIANDFFSAAALGLAAHLRIYPIMLVLPLTVVALNIDRKNWTSCWKFSLRILPLLIRHFFFAGLVFLGASLLSYNAFGWEYIDFVFLYHTRRVDSQHNFSIYFYPFWLFREEPETQQLIKKAASVVQLLAVVGTGLTPLFFSKKIATTPRLRMMNTTSSVSRFSTTAIVKKDVKDEEGRAGGNEKRTSTTPSGNRSTMKMSIAKRKRIMSSAQRKSRESSPSPTKRGGRSRTPNRREEMQLLSTSVLQVQEHETESKQEHRHKVLSLLKAASLQMIAFVALNRVITAQYFLWIFQFLSCWLSCELMKIPLMEWEWEDRYVGRGMRRLLHLLGTHEDHEDFHEAFLRVKSIPEKGRNVIVSLFYWAVAEFHWLAWAYLLEFQKMYWVRPILWVASLLFLAANTHMAYRIWKVEA